MRIKFIWLLVLGILPLNTIFAQFTDQADIPEWGLEAVDVLSKAGYISGNQDGSLAPNRTINRAEFTKIITIAARNEPLYSVHSVFPDVHPDDWFHPYVTTAQFFKFVDGYPDGEFKPGNTINRAEVAKILVKSQWHCDDCENGPDWFSGYFEELNDPDFQALPYNTTIDSLAPATEPTRIEVFEQLYRFLKNMGAFENSWYLDSSEASSNQPALPTGQVQAEPKSNDDTFRTFTPTAPKTSTAKLEVSVESGSNKQSVSAGQKNVMLSKLTIKSNGSAQLNGLQFRRVGNGDFSDFERVWLAEGSGMLGGSFAPQSDFIYLSLPNPIQMTGTQTISLWADISDNASTSSSRWVLFLPEWIDSDAKSTIGLFPLGGRDINIK